MARVLSRIGQFGPAVMLLLAACSTYTRPTDPCKHSLPKAEPDGHITLEGYYRSSFEISSFVPCGCELDPEHGAGYWLTEATGAGLRDSYSPLVDTSDPFRPGPTVYIRFEGFLSDRGSYGHMGAYPREVSVNRLLEIAPHGRCPLGSAGSSGPLPPNNSLMLTRLASEMARRLACRLSSARMVRGLSGRAA